MKLSTMLKTGSLTALAAAMAVTALPSEALARGDHGRGGWSGDSGDGGGRSRDTSRTTSRADRGPSRSDARQESPRTGNSFQQAGSPNTGNAWRRSDTPRTIERAYTPPSQGQRSFTGRDSTNFRSGPQRSETRTVERSTYTPRATTTTNTTRNYTDSSRNRTYGSGTASRTTQHYDGSHRWDGDRDGHYDGRDGDHNRWDRGWRNDNRYDWSGYRRSHYNTYHLGRYYAPYRSYSYRRLTIGFFLDSLFYSNNYWIDDPWQYRLPEAYGPYRWVRYYDDALLVDIYSGEVVDVIYGFFW